MKVAYVTAGGAGMFCGSCMRDNALAAALIEMGVDVTLVPTFTPIRTDETDVSIDRVFLGGVNVYLEQRFPFLRHLPRGVRRALDHPALLRGISRLSLERRRAEDGAVAVSLLRGERGNQADEIADLVRFVADDLRPDVVNLTNLLIGGFVPSLAARRRLPVVVTLQGDDVFLDSLTPRDRDAVLCEMRRVARSVDGFVVFNRYYRDEMSRLLEVPPERFHVVPLGLARPEEFDVAGERPADRPPTIGYLARICREKGFHRIVDAFLELRGRPATRDVRLIVGGWLGAADRPFLREQLERLRGAGASGAFERVELPDRPAKIRFLADVDVVSVPTIYREPKGLYVLEALAAGVPVVQPAHGAFPEWIEATGGGLLVPPDDTAALADALAALLGDPVRRRALGDSGRRAVAREFTADDMAQATLDVWRRIHAAAIAR